MKGLKMAAYIISGTLMVMILGLLFGFYASASNGYVIQLIQDSGWFARTLYFGLFLFCDTMVIGIISVLATFFSKYISRLSDYKKFNYYFISILSLVNFIVCLSIWFDPYYPIVMCIVYTVMNIGISFSFIKWSKAEWQEQKIMMYLYLKEKGLID